MKVIVAGPRRWIKISKDKDLAFRVHKAIRQILAKYKSDGKEIIGGSSPQLGLDTEFASLCNFLKIPYHVVLSCNDQDKMWDEEKKRIFNVLVDEASSAEYTVEGTYQEGCINQQAQRLTSWVLEDEESVLIIIKYGNLTKTQLERREAMKGSSTVVEVKV